MGDFIYEVRPHARYDRARNRPEVRRLLALILTLLMGVPACSKTKDLPAKHETSQIPAAAPREHAAVDHDHDHDDEEHSGMFVGNPVSKSIWERALVIETLEPDDRAQLVEDTISYLESGNVTEEQLNLALIVLQVVYSGEEEQAGEAYRRVAMLSAKSKDRLVSSRAEALAGTARRLSLLGNKIELEGQAIEGEDLDWGAYQGKVVLINFWSTSCVACNEELPNVQENYERFHDLGFEVVGISMDRDRQTVAGFLEAKQIPWTNLFDPRPAGHSLAQRFGVVATPTVLLVEQHGNVVSLDARGPELGRLLEQYLVNSTTGADADVDPADSQ